MKKPVFISLFIFWSLITAIMTAGLIFSEDNDRIEILKTSVNPVNDKIIPGAESEEVASALSAREKNVLSLSVISEHNTIDDCWMLIGNKVYNFTKYFSAHPGGAETMTPYCGKDGSSAYATKDKKNPSSHSVYAASLLSGYYLGDLGADINPTLAAGTIRSSETNLAVKNSSDNINTSADNKPAIPINTDLTPPPAPAGPLPDNTGASISLNLNTIARHNSADDCWMIINDKTYNLTGFFNAHPGGKESMAPYCGGDGSGAYAAIKHSSYADGLLAAYYIGIPGDSIAVAATSVNKSGPADTSPPLNILETAENRLPPAVKKVIDERFPEALITKIETEDDGRLEIKLLYEGKKYEVIFNEDGSIKKIND